MTDEQLIKRQQKANRILRAPYRKGVNYLKLVDYIRECTDKIYNNSVNRALK